MSDSSSEREIDVTEVTFDYPGPPAPLCLFMLCFPVVLLLLLYHGYMPLGLEGLVVTLILFAAALGVLIWDCFGARRRVVVNEKGLQVGRAFLPWSEVKRIDSGMLVSPARRVRIGRKPGFLESTDTSRISLPAYRFVYRDLIPLIREIKPEVEISPRIRGRLERPERAAPNRWLPAAWLVAMAAFLAVLLWWSEFGRVGMTSAFGLGIVASLWGTGNAVMLPAMEGREKALHWTAATLVVVIQVFFCHLFCLPPYFYLQVVIGTAVAIFMAGLVPVFAGELTPGKQAAVMLVLLLVPPVLYAAIQARQWPRREASRVISPGREAEEWPMPAAPVWGRSGRYVADCLWTGEGAGVFRLPSFRPVEVPHHPGGGHIMWLDEQMLIRQISADGGQEAVYLYRFRTGSEERVLSAESLSMRPGRCFDPDAGRLVAVAVAEQRSTLEIRDIAGAGGEAVSQELPDGVDWYGAAWLADGRVGVYGFPAADRESPPREGRSSLRALRIDPAGGAMRRFVSSHAYRRWYPTADLSCAFATNSGEEDEDRREGARWDLVDLTTDEKVELSGRSHRPLVAGNGAAYRVTRKGGGRVLTRVALPGGREQVLRPVPEGLGPDPFARLIRQVVGFGPPMGSEDMQLLSVSPERGMAVLESPSFLSRPSYCVLDIETGARRRINLSGVDFMGQMILTRLGPEASVLSPNGRWLLLRSQAFRSFRTLLYAVPEGWPG